MLLHCCLVCHAPLPSLRGSGWNTSPAQSYPSFRQCLIPPGSGGSWAFRITWRTWQNADFWAGLLATPLKSAVWPRNPHPGDTGPPPEKQALMGLLHWDQPAVCSPLSRGPSQPNRHPGLGPTILLSVLSRPRRVAKCGSGASYPTSEQMPGGAQACLGKERASSEKEAWLSSVERPAKCPDGLNPPLKRQSLSSNPKASCSSQPPHLSAHRARGKI